MHNITYNDIETILNLSVPNYIKNKLDTEPLMYKNLTSEEYEHYLIDVINVLTKDITKSGSHRLNEWESGWSENLQEFIHNNSTNLLIPKYHGKHRYVRWKGNVVSPLNEYFDYKIHTYFIDTIIDYYTKNIDQIYEFGCGPAYHLLRLSSQYSQKKFHGLDWTTASQKIISEINKSLNKNINGYQFNFFDPDYSINIEKNSLIYTIAALEQTGENYIKFIDYLLDKKPSVCLHLEPISELLDQNKLIDLLSIKYFEKRKYLSGFLEYLQKLEKERKIKIIDARRTYTGSYFIEGHSLIVWKPL